MSVETRLARPRPRGSLVGEVSDAIRDTILSGRYLPGTKLPSEAKLILEYGVSRTVVREAIAALRSDGLVEPRQGSGVFVLEPGTSPQRPFQGLDFQNISRMFEMLELRAPVEIEAAGLAAQRRTPVQAEELLVRLRDVETCAEAGKNTADADFALHLAIADATANPRYHDFLQMMGPKIIPRVALGMSAADLSTAIDQDLLNAEHSRIVEAILDRKEEDARDAMRVHLSGGLARYRMMLRSSGKI